MHVEDRFLSLDSYVAPKCVRREMAMSETEFLTAEELVEITGYKNFAGQRKWLDKEGWCYVVNASRRPIVGRWFARLRLAGVSTHMATTDIRPLQQPKQSHYATEPNFAALHELAEKRKEREFYDATKIKPP